MRDDRNEMLIYKAIENLEDYINDCKNVGFSGNSKRIELDDIETLISDIKIHIPEEMSRAQAIISEAENILDSAQSRADEITEQANINANGIRERAKRNADEIRRDAELERERLLDEHEITIQAKADAELMIEETKKACQDTYEHAQIETGELLDEAERCLHNCIKAVHSERDRLGVRKMQTRYNPIEEHVAFIDEDEDEVFENDESLENDDEVYTYTAQTRSRNDYMDDKDEEIEKPKKKSSIKITDFAKRVFYKDDDTENMFSDSDSFDSDESIDD